jgi:deoxyribodipyrimidine photo-lyase
MSASPPGSDASPAPATTDLRRDFADRAELHAYLVEQFPEVAARDAHESPIVGGRAEALRRVEAMVPGDYGATRNYLTGRVTGLSPYVRHGVVSMAEVRDAVLAKVHGRRPPAS